MEKYELFAEDGKHELSITEKTEAVPRKHLSNIYEILDEELAPVAFSGNYDSLYNRPRIPYFTDSQLTYLKDTLPNAIQFDSYGNPALAKGKHLIFNLKEYDSEIGFSLGSKQTAIYPYIKNGKPVFAFYKNSTDSKQSVFSFLDMFYDDSTGIGFDLKENNIMLQSRYKIADNTVMRAGALSITKSDDEYEKIFTFLCRPKYEGNEKVVKFISGNVECESVILKSSTPATYGAQIAFDDNKSGLVKVRGKAGDWGPWFTLLHSGNYNDYTVTKTGSGASGTWGISISGNAASATKLATARTISLTGSVTGSGSFDGSGNLSITTTTNHTHNYLPLSGGTITGSLQIGNSNPSSTSADPVGIVVRDLRAVSMTPSTLGDQIATFYFDTAGPIEDDSWKGILRVKAWTGSYAAWELAGPATITDTKEFYVRSGLGGGTWGSWRKLLTDNNYTSYTVKKDGTGASGTWGISITGNAATATKVNNKLTVGSKSYDGSAAVTIEASDLGLASAMLFLGTTTTTITDGETTNLVMLDGSYKEVKAGNVVLYGSKEFVWTGSAWEELGNEGSYKIVQAAVADPSASGTSNTFIATISQDANGKITATKKTVAVTNSAPTLAWGATSTIGTVAGTNLQVKMPANPNTDTKVTQTAINAADYTNWRPLIWGSSNSGTEGFTPSTVTDGVYTAQTLSCQPSSGTIRATTFKGNLTGNATTATKLATARTIRTNLASTSAASFDGSANITPGVTGTLPITNGGTGATTATTARNNLGAQSKVLYGSSAPSDSTGSNGDMYIALESGDFKKDIVDLIYPVGSIYISMNSTNPSTLFGGTWEAFGQGRVLIGAGTGNDGNTSLSFPAGFTGGEYKHYLAKSEIPSHSHSFSGTTAANSRGHTHSYTKATGVQGHTLTIAEIPSHEHAINYKQIVSGASWYGNSPYYLPYNPTYDTGYIKATATGGGGSHNHGLGTSSVTTGSESQNHTHTFSGTTNQNTDGGASHNNIQPYIGVYMWKRTA